MKGRQAQAKDQAGLRLGLIFLLGELSISEGSAQAAASRGLT